MKKILILTAIIAAAGWVRAAVDPINGTNTVGYVTIGIAANATNTIIGVPFEQCLGAGVSGMLSDLVSTNNLVHSGTPAAADQLVVLTTNGTGRVYYYYWLKTGMGWETNATYKLNGDVEVGVYPPPATNFPVARGLGFWLKRPAAAAVDVYVKGQVPTNSVAVMLAGNTNLTLISLGNVTNLGLNAENINWGTRYAGVGVTHKGQDKLMVITNGNGAYVTYYFSGVKWVDQLGADPTVMIQPGQGFWYLRRGSSDLTFTPVVPQQ
jgi:hypothetical protein